MKSEVIDAYCLCLNSNSNSISISIVGDLSKLLKLEKRIKRGKKLYLYYV
jgi:hypothetical protein